MHNMQKLVDIDAYALYCFAHSDYNGFHYRRTLLRRISDYNGSSNKKLHLGVRFGKYPYIPLVRATNDCRPCAGAQIPSIAAYA